jgi:stage V sporulation protein D (sporulation-specific penicillin-binding protein)
MKIFSAAAWLKAGTVPRNKLYYGSGTITLYDTTIKSTHFNGMITMDDAIRLSDNVAVIRSMMDIRSKQLYDTLYTFGFGQRVCSDMPGESPGILRPVSGWSGLSKYSISIGQEISVNALQLAAAYGAVANGGVYIEPSLIDSIENNSGHRIQKFYPKSRGRILSEEHAGELKKMLRSVVISGTGKNAALEDYAVAGKTGTAQKSLSTGGYIEGAYTASFAGFAPYDNPAVVILVVVDEPKGMTHGGQVAAPVFRKVAGDILPYLGVEIPEVSSYEPENKMEEALPAAFDGKLIPDFSSLNEIESLSLIADIQDLYTLTFQFKGKGHVASQTPPAGTPVTDGVAIELNFE